MTAVPKPRGIRSKQSSVTLSDLFFLVIGVALALSIRWESEWRTTRHPSLPKMPIWVWDGRFVEEAIEKTCLALMPLMLWRRVRIGGVCRPAELLLPAFGMLPVVDWLDWALWDLEDRFEINMAGDLGPFFWRSHIASGIVCVVAISTIILRRRKLGDRANSALLTLAAASSFAWLQMPMLNLHLHLSEFYEFGPVGETVLAIAANTITYFVPAILGAAAVRDAIRRPECMTLLGWVGLLLAACEVIIAPPVNLWGTFMPAIPPLSEFQMHAMYFGGALVAGILGVLLAPYIGKRWDNWFSPASPDPAPSGTLTE